jgi:RpiB/LacA/LacB family sugar-phosphate isomerase
MHYLIIPLAGRGSRFLAEGFTLPKQMLPVQELTTFDYSMNSINLSDFEIIVVMRQEQVDNGLLDFVKMRVSKSIRFIVIEEQTRGSVETVLRAENFIDMNSPMTIFTMDVAFSEKYTAKTFSTAVDGGVLTFKSNSPNYSYAKVESDKVIETAEKLPISENALVGIYYFAKAFDFFSCAREMLDEEDVTQGEFYIAPLYNYLVKRGQKVSYSPVKTFYVFGTPEEYRFFSQTIARSLNLKRIGLCSDHSGVDTKSFIKICLESKGYSVVDYGTHSHKDCDYSDFVERAVGGYLRGEVDLVIASCRSGQGVAIAGGAFKDIYPTVVYSSEAAKYAVSHNCSNFLAIPSTIFNQIEKVESLMEELLTARFEGGRHQLRLMKVAEARLRK